MGLVTVALTFPALVVGNENSFFDSFPDANDFLQRPVLIPFRSGRVILLDPGIFAFDQAVESQQDLTVIKPGGLERHVVNG